MMPSTIGAHLGPPLRVDETGTRRAATHWPMPWPQSSQELPDRLGDPPGMRLEREVPGVEEAHLGIRDVTQERLRTGGKEERVVPSPDGQERRPVLRK